MKRKEERGGDPRAFILQIIHGAWDLYDSRRQLWLLIELSTRIQKVSPLSPCFLPHTVKAERRNKTKGIVSVVFYTVHLALVITASEAAPKIVAHVIVFKLEGQTDYVRRSTIVTPVTSFMMGTGGGGGGKLGGKLGS